MVHQDIGCTLRGELSGSDGEHVGPTTEAIGELDLPVEALG